MTSADFPHLESPEERRITGFDEQMPTSTGTARVVLGFVPGPAVNVDVAVEGTKLSEAEKKATDELGKQNCEKYHNVR